MKSDNGRDTVTLENYAIRGQPDAINTRWIFSMYGSPYAAEEDPRKRGRTFHEEHRATETHGLTPTTIVAEPSS